MDECSDDLLITFVREGNQEAYKVLKRKYDKIVYKWINEKRRMLLQNKIEIEDVYYQIWERFDKILDEYDSHLGYFPSYFKLCTERFIIKMVRELNSNNKKALTSAMSLDSMVKDSDGLSYIDSVKSSYLINEFESNYEIKQKQEKVNQIILNLTKEERKILELKKDGKTYKEIATLLQIKEKRVDYLLSKVKKKLTNC